MSNLSNCIYQLNNAGLDVFEIGCRWQEKTPATLADYSDVIAGVSVLISSILLFYVFNELVRSYFRPPSN